MDKYKEIEEFGKLIERCIIKELQPKIMDVKLGGRIATKLYNKGYRNVSGLKEWLKCRRDYWWSEWKESKKGKAKYKCEIYQEVFDKLGGEGE